MHSKTIRLASVSALSISLAMLTSCRMEDFVPEEFTTFLEDVTGEVSQTMTMQLNSLDSPTDSNFTKDFKDGFKSGYSAGYAEALKQSINSPPSIATATIVSNTQTVPEITNPYASTSNSASSYSSSSNYYPSPDTSSSQSSSNSYSSPKSSHSKSSPSPSSWQQPSSNSWKSSNSWNNNSHEKYSSGGSS